MGGRAVRGCGVEEHAARAEVRGWRLDVRGSAGRYRGNLLYDDAGSGRAYDMGDRRRTEGQRSRARAAGSRSRAWRIRRDGSESAAAVGDLEQVSWTRRRDIREREACYRQGNRRQGDD